jgi:hypothetical protein
MAKPRSFAVPMTPEQTHVRAQLAAIRRHHGPDAELPAEAAAMEQAALDRHIDEVVARAPKMTPDQADRIRRIFRYGPA